jgi:hypothetical protein
MQCNKEIIFCSVKIDEAYSEDKSQMGSEDRRIEKVSPKAIAFGRFLPGNGH